MGSEMCIRDSLYSSTIFFKELILNMTNITFLHFKFIQILVYKILMFNLYYDRMLLKIS